MCGKYGGESVFIRKNQEKYKNWCFQIGTVSAGDDGSTLLAFVSTVERFGSVFHKLTLIFQLALLLLSPIESADWTQDEQQNPVDDSS
jgi:hypothetical protein